MSPTSTTTEALAAKQSVPGDNVVSATADDPLAKLGDTHQIQALRHLVSKASIYSKFLYDRMTQQQAKQVQEKLRAQKRAENKKKKELELSSAPVRSSRRAGPAPKKELEEDKPQKRSKRNTTKNVRDEESTEFKNKRAKKDSQTQKEDEDKDEGEEEQEEIIEDNCDLDDDILEDQFRRTINGEQVSDRQPRLVTGGILRDYQLVGVEWLVSLYENGLNGILGDEMGLGKTLQCISFIAHLIEKGVAGPFMIVAPLSTLGNWVAEFKKFTPTVPVVLYHGDPNQRTDLRKNLNVTKRISIPGENYEWENGSGKTKGGKKKAPTLAAMPVVITSYEIVMRDRKVFSNNRWQYIIVDEGHRLKNLNCRLIKELKSYNSVNRLLLTGTPLQNSLAELWSLLNFLLPEIFNDLESFQAWFDFKNRDETEDSKENNSGQKFMEEDAEKWLLHQLHLILEPFLLRRLKLDVAYNIPLKKELVVYTHMSELQQEMYKSSLLGKFREVFDKHDISENEDDEDDKAEKKDETTEETEHGEAKDEEESIGQRGLRRRRSVADSSYAEVSDRKFFSIFNASGANTDSKSSKGRVVSTQEDKKAKRPETSQRNIKLQNLLMHLRKICNHPYLIDYPLTPGGDFKIDESMIQASGKFMMLDRLLPKLREQGHRVLLFSQMTEMLNIIQDYCYLRNYRFCRLDGSVSHVDRQHQIAEFNTDMDIFMFMLSTRAGGLGINLTSADTVIIFDSDWNPQSDLQAMDRCHRIGQTKPVLVYRFVTDHTVERTMLNRAKAKRRLEKAVVHKGKFKGKASNQVGSSITSEEIESLVKDTSGFLRVTNTKDVISDDDLDMILNRSLDSMKGNLISSGNTEADEKHEEKEHEDNRKFDIIDVVTEHDPMINASC